MDDPPQPTEFLPWLVEAGALTPLVAERVARVGAQSAERLPAILLKLGLLSESQLADALARFCSLARLDAQRMAAGVVAADAVNSEFLRSREIVLLALAADEVQIACWDPLDDYALRAVEFALGRNVVRHVGTFSELRTALERLYPRSADTGVTADVADDLSEDQEVDRLKDLARDSPVIRLVQRLIERAVLARASDIHLEPSDSDLLVRLRLDGLLGEYERHSLEQAPAIISRIKIMANINIAERRLPQDGRMRAVIQGKPIDLRVATSPTLHGESVVLRILDRQDVALDFDALGFDSDLKQVLRDAIGRPHGIVLVTGPTGSGKTTTLYAALKELNTPQRKILTVEDPVEYVLAGVNQVPIRPQIGLTFAHTLRAFLRQDPDVLLVGEIRDQETAEVAVQAALTGHLLLSTLHTNSAAAAVTRLLDMGIDDFLLTSTIHVILAQRLVRRLCSHCREPYRVTADIHARYTEHHLNSTWHRARGCELCQQTGFRGRTAIYEALTMSASVRAAVHARSDAHAIEKIAVAEGMRTMVEHGIQLVCAGSTTLDEVLRVTSNG